MSGHILGNYRLMTARDKDTWLAADDKLAAPKELLDKIQSDLSSDIDDINSAVDAIGVGDVNSEGLANLNQLYNKIVAADADISAAITQAANDNDLVQVDIPAYNETVAGQIALTQAIIESLRDELLDQETDSFNDIKSNLDGRISDEIETQYSINEYNLLTDSLGTTQTGTGFIGIIQGGNTTLSSHDLGADGDNTVASSKILEKFSITDYHTVSLEVNAEKNRLMFVETKETSPGNTDGKVLLSLNI